jgi:hypothetical protein
MRFDFSCLGRTFLVVAIAAWVRRRWDLNSEVSNLHAEVQADAFALELIAVEDRASLGRFLDKRRMPSDPRFSHASNSRRDALLREGLSYARQGARVAGALYGVALPPLSVSTSFTLLLIATAFLWTQSQSLSRAIIASSSVALLAFLLAGWAFNVSQYRTAQTVIDIERRIQSRR